MRAVETRASPSTPHARTRSPPPSVQGLRPAGAHESPRTPSRPRDDRSPSRARVERRSIFPIERTSVAAARTVGAARVTPRDRASAAPRALGARNRALAPPPSVARADMDATGVTVVVVRRWCCCVAVVARAHVVVVVASIIVVVVWRRPVVVAPSRGGTSGDDVVPTNEVYDTTV